jgi:excisionase family DNA binding protein
MSNDDEILTLNEAARFLRISRRHLVNILKGRVKGAPPLAYVRAGRRILFRRSTLAAWLILSERRTMKCGSIHGVA